MTRERLMWKSCQNLKIWVIKTNLAGARLVSEFFFLQSKKKNIGEVGGIYMQ